MLVADKNPKKSHFYDARVISGRVADIYCLTEGGRSAASSSLLPSGSLRKEPKATPLQRQRLTSLRRRKDSFDGESKRRFISPKFIKKKKRKEKQKVKTTYKFWEKENQKYGTKPNVICPCSITTAPEVSPINLF